jgi:hypothetical protein
MKENKTTAGRSTASASSSSSATVACVREIESRHREWLFVQRAGVGVRVDDKNMTACKGERRATHITSSLIVQSNRGS